MTPEHIRRVRAAMNEAHLAWMGIRDAIDEGCNAAWNTIDHRYVPEQLAADVQSAIVFLDVALEESSAMIAEMRAALTTMIPPAD